MTTLQLPDLASIDAARQRIDDFVIRSPLIRLNTCLSDREIYLKLENLQPSGSFKIRAAASAIRALPSDQLSLGVVTTSTGNFGRALATVAKKMGVDCTAIVPNTSSQSKVNALRDVGAQVEIVPFNDWWTMLATRTAKGLTGVFISPVAEQTVVEGNGTIALEILEDLPDVESVYVPCGGGGLVSGIASVLRVRHPEAKIVACETDTSRPFAAAFSQNQPVMVEHTPSFVDGIGGRAVLEAMWPMVKQAVNSCAVSSLHEVADAIRLLAIDHHVIAEGAGAVPVAAALSDGRSGKTVCIVSGGNLAEEKLSKILAGEIPGLG